MPCTQPNRAHRASYGRVIFGSVPPNGDALLLPCGECIGCRTSKAKEWALRNHLELQQHEAGVFTTLTYEDRWLPPTLEKEAYSGFIKRLRSQVRDKLGTARLIRHFGSGEYGETTARPHYHGLVYGLHESEQDLIRRSWHMGNVKTVAITPASINYVAGYTAKKIEDKYRQRYETIVDPQTGEEIRWQPPFIQMSRNPGIGAAAREHTQAWREYAINNGFKQAVPRYLHEAWKKKATELELVELEMVKGEKQIAHELTLQQLEAQSHINESRQALKAAKRKL